MPENCLIVDVDDQKAGDERIRIIAIWHQKTDGAEIQTIGCHADKDYLITFGRGEPKWVSFKKYCASEINDFFRTLRDSYKAKRDAREHDNKEFGDWLDKFFENEQY